MKVLEQEIIVSKKDLDDLNHVNNMVYINWVLDIAKKHWNNLVDIQTIKKFYWVLLEHQIKYISPAFLGENIKIKTYIHKTEGVKSIRIVEIYNNETNKLLVKSKTTWCLINSQTHKPNRITNEIKQAFK